MSFSSSTSVRRLTAGDSTSHALLPSQLVLLRVIVFLRHQHHYIVVPCIPSQRNIIIAYGTLQAFLVHLIQKQVVEEILDNQRPGLRNPAFSPSNSKIALRSSNDIGPHILHDLNQFRPPYAL